MLCLSSDLLIFAIASLLFSLSTVFWVVGFFLFFFLVMEKYSFSKNCVWSNKHIPVSAY